ncbi:MAG: hypothetical protein RL693_1913, partial [Verrucomicrobiota bacterium]
LRGRSASSIDLQRRLHRMETVTKTSIGTILFTAGGIISLLAGEGVVTPQIETTPAPLPNQASAVEKTVLSADQLKAVSTKLSSRSTKIDKEEATKALISKFRSIDPFGLPTYPTAEEEKPDEVIESTTTKTSEPERITLGHALRTMKINGINLDRAEVLIGSRNMFEGDIAEVFYKGQTFMAELTEVSGYRLVFVDTKTKEEFTKSLTMLPAPSIEPSKDLDSKLNLRQSARQLESVAK